MSILQPAPQPWPDRVLAIIRIISGLIFITAGSTKLFGFPSNPVPMPPLGVLSQIWIGAWMEVIGGILIVLGLFTRPTALILAGEMAVAYFQFHAPGSFWPTVNMGIPAILYCFFFLYLMVAGAGAWSVDRVIAGRRRVAPAVVLLFTSLPLLGAIPPLKPEALRERSDAIIVANIVDFTSEEKDRGNGAVDTHFAVRVKILDVEKSAIPLKGKTITVHGWNVKHTPGGMTGPSGHHTIDYRESLRNVLRRTSKQSVKVRMYLTLRDRKYALVAPNGLEIIGR